MAIEYSWYGDSDVDTTTLRAFVAAAVGGRQQPDGIVARDGLQVFARHVAADEVNPAIALFGFEQRLRATFRFANLADPPTTERNTALMVHVLVTFAQRHGGNGVLLFNGEQAVLQYDGDGIVLAADWDDWTESAELAPLVARFARRVLAQPLL